MYCTYVLYICTYGTVQLQLNTRDTFHVWHHKAFHASVPNLTVLSKTSQKFASFHFYIAFVNILEVNS